MMRIYLFADCNGLIVPQELPSVLSLVYSNIPPVKKGTDSRVGFGFRLGEHADFQVMFELGPQKFTKPIGMHNKFDLFFVIPYYVCLSICLFQENLRTTMIRILVNVWSINRTIGKQSK